MFTLAVVFDTIKVAASQLNGNVIAALSHNVNGKYANRILPNVGLCVAHFDFVDVSEGHIRNGDGCTYYKTTFRLVIFRPFVGETLVGKVKSCDEKGVRITMGFFDDIYVVWDGMPQPSAYDRTEAAWFWIWTDLKNDGLTNGEADEDDAEDLSNSAVFQDPFQSQKEERFYFYKDESVRFVVEADEFNEPEPPGPETWKAKAQAATSQRTSSTNEPIEVKATTKRLAPYRIKASMSSQGTGVVGWWTDSQVQSIAGEE